MPPLIDFGDLPGIWTDPFFNHRWIGGDPLDPADPPPHFSPPSNGDGGSPGLFPGGILSNIDKLGSDIGSAWDQQMADIGSWVDKTNADMGSWVDQGMAGIGSWWDQSMANIGSGVDAFGSGIGSWFDQFKSGIGSWFDKWKWWILIIVAILLFTGSAGYGISQRKK